MKWGIQVPFEDSFLWVTFNDTAWTLRVLLFDSAEEAQDYMMKVWPSGKIAEYKGSDNES